MMDKYIDRFPLQLSEAFTIGSAIPRPLKEVKYKQVLICGMGGSGIGGAFVKEITEHEIRVPVIIHQAYTLPEFANHETMVICSSYSGNTEETISCFRDAISRKCRIICITTGGKLEALALENSVQFIKLPGGMPPRSCLGYSLVIQLFVFNRMGLIGDGFMADIQRSADLLQTKKSDIIDLAKKISGQLHHKLPIIYVSADISSMAIRWKQQINENSKMHCFGHALPEMNHNELVSFEKQDDHIAVLLLRNKTDHERIQKRFELVKELLDGKTGSITEIFSEGDNYIERMFYFIHLGDWVSFYLAQLNHVDPMEIKILDDLKQMLSK